MSQALFKDVSFRLSFLVEQIAMGHIGLPDLQRPFVWPNKKVRDLFDSMYRGYPVGYLLLWQNGAARGVGSAGVNHKTIGVEPKHLEAPRFDVTKVSAVGK